jgi:hypothetical protein
VRRVRRVDDVDRPRTLAHHNPELVVVWAEGHVVRAEADEDAVDDSLARQPDHNELPARVVRHVRELPVRRERCDMRRAEAAERARHPQPASVEQRHGSGAGADHDGRAFVSLDVLRIGRHPEPALYPTRREVDDEELVQRLGRHEPDALAAVRGRL